jgi:hypothetical protein
MRSAGFDHDKIKIVVNRYQASDIELLQHAESLFEQKVGWLVPNDYPVASGSLNKGVPLTEHDPRAALTQWYVTQAATMAGDQPLKGVGVDTETGQKDSLFSRYWGGLTFSTKARS